MKIGIDARWIFPEISGIGAYTRELVKHLAQIDTANSYVLFFEDPAISDRTIVEANLEKAKNLTTQLLPFGVFSLKNQLNLPGILADSGIDVFHSTNYMIPFLAFPRRRRGKIKCAVTIHDVIPLIFPDHAPKSKKARFFPIYKRLMIEVGIRADAVVTDSESSRFDVIKYLRMAGQSHALVKSIYCGVSPRFKPPEGGRKMDSASAAQNKRKRTILYVGRSDPYKNLATLIMAFFSAVKMCPFPVELVIAGSVDPRYPEAAKLTSELSMEGSVKWTGYLSDDQLVAAYQNADVLVHPSKYEGFGLQIVEAMACGTPVVAGNAGSVPEISGDAAILLDPEDVNGFADKIQLVLTDSNVWNSMSEKGIAQASKFTWARTAREMLSVYEEIGRA
jgi:glycosyltransferase involved in cell wall biosynthesis